MDALAFGKIHLVKDEAPTFTEFLRSILHDDYRWGSCKINNNYYMRIWFVEDTIVCFDTSLKIEEVIFMAKTLLVSNDVVECQSPRVIVAHRSNYTGWRISDAWRWVDDEEPPPISLSFVDNMISQAQDKVARHTANLDRLEQVRSTLVPRSAAKLLTSQQV